MPWAIPLSSPFGSAGGLRRYSTSFSPCPPLPSWSIVLELFFAVFLLTVAAAATLLDLPAALPSLYLVLPLFLVVVLEAMTLNAEVPAAQPLLYLVLLLFLAVVLEALALNTGWRTPRSPYSTWRL